LYDLQTSAETIRVLTLERLQFENDQRRRQREQAEAERLAYMREREARRQAKEARRQAKEARRQARALKRQKRIAKMIKRQALRNIQEGVGKYTYKAEFGSQTQTGANISVSNLNIPFTSDNMDEIEIVIKSLLTRLPAGYYYSVKLNGDTVKYTSDGVLVESEDTTIAITRVGYDLDKHVDELRNHKRIEMPSERVAIIKSIYIFYEPNQGGKFTCKGFDDVKEALQNHKVFCPKTRENCGKVCLSMYKVDVEEGHLSLEYMKSKSPVPVTDSMEEAKTFEECILLHEKHYYIVKSKELMKTQAKFRDQARKACNKLKEVLVYDIESVRHGEGDIQNQMPVMLSWTRDGENATTYYGLDCSDRFVKYLLSKEGRGVKYVYAFNGGNYDHILIRNALIQNGLMLEESRRSVNSIIRITARVGGVEVKPTKKRPEPYTKSREIVFSDIRNFTNGSLAQNLKSLGLTSKGSFDYDKINENMEGEDLQKLTEYCEWDTCGSFKVLEKLSEPFTKLGLDINKLFTLSQGAFKLLKQTWKETEMEGFRQPKYVDELGRLASIGGRTECFKHYFKSSEYDDVKHGKKAYDEMEDYLRYLDVVSLYPSAMSKNLYPIGQHKNTFGYKKGYLGIYNCVISKPNNLKYPVCYDKSRGSYNLLENSGYYTSVDIDEMRRYGYKVDVGDGVYWEESSNIFTKYIDEMYKLKNQACKNTPDYNNAKLMINAVFGKTLQNDDTVEYFVIKNKADLVKMYTGRELTRFTMEWDFTGGDETGYYTYTTSGNEKKMTDKMGHIGAFILSYSKRVIYEQLVKTDAYYMDTDSLFVHRCDAEKIPQGKELGQFSDDLDGGRIIRALFISKKMYHLEYVMPDGSIRIKSTGKGVDRKAMMLEHYEEMIEGNTVKITQDMLFIRKVKEGKVLFKNKPVKQLKMNSGGRIFKGLNTSYPLGHMDA
jgi:hypothetical protein